MSDYFPTPFKFYNTQSDITNPRDQVNFLANLPRNIPALCKIVRGIFLHIESAMQKDIKLTPQNGCTYTRYVDLMFEQIRSLSNQPILEKRPEEKRLIGNCRDDSVLLCSLLRHLNIPSRVRYGFSKYFAGIDPKFGANHVVCEYWHTNQERWILVDPGQDDYLCKKNQLPFDPHDIPRDKFVTAANAWTLCRTKQADPMQFGFGPIEPTLKGQWYIQTELIHELAAFNKMEMLLRDRWGLGDCWHTEESKKDNLKLLDEIAFLILEHQKQPQSQEIFTRIQTLYKQNALRVPNVITCYKYDGTIEQFNIQKRKWL